MKKKIKIGTGALNQSVKRFVDAWRKVETGASTESQEYLTFDDLETLLRVLTPTRWTLLRVLRREGPMSIRALSNSLRRDYKNVHTDVKELGRMGLVTLTVEKRIMVPWDAVLAEVRLEAA
jgi:predicted transcriptional regulator